MPIYHFNVHDGVSMPDPEGHELPDLDAAKREAISLSGNLIRDMGEEFWQGDEWKLEVTDDLGLILFSLVFFATHAPSTAVQAEPTVLYEMSRADASARR